ncbi:MAG: tetraacyldisaccharide 4'-kinase [Bacteroidales bacterium]
MSFLARHKWRILLIPFSWIYGSVIWIRNMLYESGVLESTEFNIPVISVGNIAVGGTGKTPHVEYLAGLLKEEYRVATLSRGYRRRTRDFRLATLNSTAAEIGDEPLQIKHRFPDITVAVDRSRRNGIRQLMKLTPQVEVILLDDAYQHRAVRPGLSILLMDYSRPMDHDLLLPAGRLREPAGNRNRANLLLVTRSPERVRPIERREVVKRLGLSINQHLYFTSVRYGALFPVFEGVPGRELSWFRENVGAVLIVTGIAQPRPVRQFARGISTQIREISFPDHHRYSAHDLDRIMNIYREMKQEGREVLVLTTEKDAARLKEFTPPEPFRDACHAVRIHIHFLNDDEQAFNKQIINYVVSNKRSSILYQREDQ